MENQTVREILQDLSIKNQLMSLYQEEIIRGFSAHGMLEQAKAYVATTIQRFENPFLNHHLRDIAINHEQKIERRAFDFMRWVNMKESTFKFERLQNLADRK